MTPAEYMDAFGPPCFAQDFLEPPNPMLHLLPSSKPVAFNEADGKLVLTIQGGNPQADTITMASLSQDFLHSREVSFYAETIETEFLVKQIQDRQWWDGLVMVSYLLSPNSPQQVTHTLDMPGPIKITVKDWTPTGITLHCWYE